MPAGEAPGEVMNPTACSLVLCQPGLPAARGFGASLRGCGVEGREGSLFYSLNQAKYISTIFPALMRNRQGEAKKGR